MIPTLATSQNWGKNTGIDFSLVTSYWNIEKAKYIVHIVFSLFYLNHIFLADQTNVGWVFEKNQIQRTVSWKNWQSPGNFLGGYLTFSEKLKTVTIYINQVLDYFFDIRSHVSKLGIWIFKTMISVESLVQFLIPTSSGPNLWLSDYKNLV
jgi:hypothetical protein